MILLPQQVCITPGTRSSSAISKESHTKRELGRALLHPFVMSLCINMVLEDLVTSSHIIKRSNDRVDSILDERGTLEADI
jgi:hypothetical protein